MSIYACLPQRWGRFFISPSIMRERRGFMESRIGFVGIVVEEARESAPKVNEILTQYGHLVVGRLGVPYKERSISVITLVVEGSNEDIGAMTGKLGKIPGISVKSMMSHKNLNSEGIL
jgi:putative iron-only hydrogenase system regulator